MNTPHDTLRIATYNIHKGVQGLGPRRRLEIHNLGHAVEQLDADIVCLQEVRKLHRRQQQYFTQWPELPQAEFLAPEGYEAIYRTNAVTRHGEHGNALLSRWPVLAHRHEDMSDHRFEQRGLLHVEVDVQGRVVHVIVVHFGLLPASRMRQVEQLGRYIDREVPAAAPLVVAGDFNDWGEKLDGPMTAIGLRRARAGTERAQRTFPSAVPLFALDRVYTRGLQCVATTVPRNAGWARMSDHLPLVVDLQLD